MQIFIKNMVCNRCVAAVKGIFSELNIPVDEIKLGEVKTKKSFSEIQLKELEKKLEQSGFEHIKDAVLQLNDKIKTLIIQKISELDVDEDFVLSEFLSSNLHRDYSALSKNFSQNENITLEQYFILQKIEKVKELLLYNEFTLTEIAGKLGYKSVQHLSTQFKNNTGFTPTEFKKLKNHNRKGLDEF